MDFSSAIDALNHGKKVSRESWSNNDLCTYASDGFLEIHLADGKCFDFSFSEEDIKAKDWIIIE